jgi:hypothetical protein
MGLCWAALATYSDSSLEASMNIPAAVLSIFRASCCLGLAQLVAFASQAHDQVEAVSAVAQAAAIPAASGSEISTPTLVLTGLAVVLFLGRRLGR